MITNLKVTNYALIEHLDIDINNGFAVITGETGAGKSIILGALSLLLGHRADTKAVKDGTQKCVVEAHFNIGHLNMKSLFDAEDVEYDAEDTILRREITAAGKSRAFVNDTPVALSTLRLIGERLVDIHSQHQNLLLHDSGFQLSVIDTMAGCRDKVVEYKAAYDAYAAAVRRHESLKRQTEEDAERADYMRFQYQELSDANLSDPEEQEELESLAKQMTCSEDIKSAIYKAVNLIDNDETGAISQLRQAANAMESVADSYPSAAALSERLYACYVETKDVAQELGRRLDNIDYDPRELERVNERLDLFYSLQRKHHCNSLQQLMDIRDSLEEKLSAIDNSEEKLAECEAEMAETKAKALALAKCLTKIRKEAAAKVDKEMVARLVPLGIPKVQFITQLTPTDLSPSGADKAVFLFTANSSSQPHPVAEIASGGEIARVMLSLKALTGSAATLPTIIFDEIDTGVSGKVAEAMAGMMKEMAAGGRQVISITHLPQIASAGTTHYRVVKTDTGSVTHTDMTRLTHEERVTEIAQMISGADISYAARQQACELLDRWNASSVGNKPS